MASQEKFWDRMAARYSRQPVADEEAYQIKLDMTQRYFNPEMNVLEIGCGTGSTAIVHAPHVGHYLATDISANMITIAGEKAAAEKVENISFKRASLAELSLPDESQDAVLALSVLHLLADWRQAITEIGALLKPGGLLISSTACIGDMGLLMRMLPPVMGMLPFVPSVQVFTVAQLKTEFDKAGFLLEESWQPAEDKALFVIARKQPDRE